MKTQNQAMPAMPEVQGVEHEYVELADGHMHVATMGTGAPVLLTGIGLPDDGLHSPNEKLDLAQLWSGIEIFGRFFELFAARGGATAPRRG